MITTAERIPLALPRQSPQSIQDRWLFFACRRLNEAFDTAKYIPFDDSSRLVFFSDCHRGDNSRVDLFARNEELFLTVLEQYYRQGFTYVEVGDGDELWQNRGFADIRRAHGQVFDLFHRFHRQGRLHIIIGNHDIQNKQDMPITKDGLPGHESLILKHTRSGQQVFVTHGHQVDIKSDQLHDVSKWIVRHVWRPLRHLGFGDTETWSRHIQQKRSRASRLTPVEYLMAREVALEQRLIGRASETLEDRFFQWLSIHPQVTICGHTHRPMAATYGSAPYFNTGSCTSPGYITGLEIRDGDILLVKWLAGSSNGTLHVERKLMAPPRRLCLFNS